MSIKIVACKTLQNELNAAMSTCNCTYDIQWIESGLHNYPKKLHHALQDALDLCTDVETVLLAMGYCGNSVVGLKTHGFQLIIPRIDDCISLLLGSIEKRKEQSQGGSTYFMTEGWLEGERNIWKEYQYTTEKYGSELGLEIFNTMFQNYRNLALINTHCYDMKPAAKEAKRIAKHLNLSYVELPGNIHYLKELLGNPPDPKKFLIIPPYTEVALSDCTCYE